MTSEFSAASLHSPQKSVAREGLAPMSLLLIGVVFAVAIGLRQVVPLNTDVSWLIVVCERMLDGQHLYRDIIEINPPMAAFAYLPGVALARVLGIDPRHVIDAQLLLLAAASLVAVSRILRLSPSRSKMNWGPLAIWAAAVVTILPMHEVSCLTYHAFNTVATVSFIIPSMRLQNCLPTAKPTQYGR